MTTTRQNAEEALQALLVLAFDWPFPSEEDIAASHQDSDQMSTEELEALCRKKQERFAESFVTLRKTVSEVQKKLKQGAQFEQAALDQATKKTFLLTKLRRSAISATAAALARCFAEHRLSRFSFSDARVKEAQKDAKHAFSILKKWANSEPSAQASISAHTTFGQDLLRLSWEASGERALRLAQEAKWWTDRKIASLERRSDYSDQKPLEDMVKRAQTAANVGLNKLKAWASVDLPTQYRVKPRDFRFSDFVMMTARLAVATDEYLIEQAGVNATVNFAIANLDSVGKTGVDALRVAEECADLLVAKNNALVFKHNRASVALADVLSMFSPTAIESESEDKEEDEGEDEVEDESDEGEDEEDEGEEYQDEGDDEGDEGEDEGDEGEDEGDEGEDDEEDSEYVEDE